MDKSVYRYNSWPYLSAPEKYVKDEYLKRTGQLLGAAPAERYLTFKGKTPFMRMTSGITLKENSTDVGIRAILDPLNNQLDRYTESTGFKPAGGITSISIKYKNDIGTIRTADIKWQVYTKKEFESLDEFFMNPGKLVLLEWGMADGANNAFTLDLINRLRESNFENQRMSRVASSGYECRYDAMLGMISNFDWSYTDGKYECTTTLISPGAFFGDLNLEASTIPAADARGDIKSFPYIKDWFKKNIKDSTYLNTWIDNDKNKNYVQEDDRTYIRWALFEAILNRLYPLNQCFSDDIYISCPDSKQSNGSTYSIDFKTIDPTIAIWNPGTSSEQFASFKHNSSEHKGRTGLLKNLYLNVDMIIPALYDSTTVGQLFSKIYSKLQSAGNNAWSFRTITRTISLDDYKSLDASSAINGFYGIPGPGTISTTIDDRYSMIAITDILHTDVASFDVLNGNSTITDINVNSKMSGAVVMSMVAATDSNFTLLTGFPNFVSLRSENYRSASLDTFADVSRKRIQDKLDSDAKLKRETVAKQETSKPDTYSSTYKNWPEVNLIAADPEQQKMLVIDQNSESVLLPVDLEVTMIGMSGFRVGNVIQTDVLPEAYGRDAWFQIIGIDDTIDSSGWKTKLTARFRNISKKSKTKFPLTEETKIEIADAKVNNLITSKGNPDDLENTCFDKYKISDMNMNRFGMTNDITIDVKKNLIYLCKEFLQPLSVMLKASNLQVSVVSAFRSNEVNIRYNETIDDLHQFGSSVDIKVRNLTNGKYLSTLEVARIINVSGLLYDMIVVEDYWVHVSYVNEAAAGRKNRKLKQQIVFDNNTNIKSIVTINL
jgi:hypothetical protein